MIKQIYFDFGNVLVTYDKTFTTVCNDFSLNFKEFKEYFNQLNEDLNISKIETKDFWQQCVDKYNLKNAQNYEFTKSWVLDYGIIKPVQDLIYNLSDKIDIGIISNVCSDVWQPAYKYKMVPNIKYKKVYLSCDLKIAKPHPDIYTTVQRESNVNPDEILFIDDFAENLIIPKQLGWQTILFDPNHPEVGVREIIKKIPQGLITQNV